MIRMSRVGVEYLEDLEDPETRQFVRAVHVTGDLENLGQGTPEDQRYFVTVADERTILHFGSSYGGNALLGKIAHGLRQAAYDGWASKKFLGEQYMLIGIHDKETGKDYHICGGFPSASGKTNLAMMLAPDALGDRYHVSFYGDDIAWLWVDEPPAGSTAMNPEYGVFGVAKDTNEGTNPTALASIGPGHRRIFTNVAYNRVTHEVWWEGRTPEPPADTAGWLDWKGNPIADREPGDDSPWAHPNSRFTTTLDNVPNIANDYNTAAGVPIDAIIFGGRTRDREPLIRAITDLAEGVYDGLTLGAEATFAAEGVEGMLRYDPMSNRPFMAYGEGDYADALPQDRRRREGAADLRARQLVPARPGGRPLPVARATATTCGRCCGCCSSRTARSRVGRPRSASSRPRRSSTSRASTSRPRTSRRSCPIDVERWRQEIGFRAGRTSEQFPNLPEEIWEAHRRVRAALDAAQH